MKKKIREDVYISFRAGTYEVEAETKEEAKEKIEALIYEKYSSLDIDEIIIG
ncbi:hypothetical protein [Cetobacterium sp.]|uniref:hypothetical protein n=1 Tax=Cetobacterium sp. TaxID=2071632 RepID=UPI003EE6C497